MRYEKAVHPDVKESFKVLVKWLRERFFFPIHVPVYVKASDRIRSKDRELCVGTFFRPDSFQEEPYIRIATGDYEKLILKRGLLQARIAILLPLLHELTHYYQWVNSIQKSPIGEERQAARYAHDLMEEFLDDLGLLDSL